MESREHGVFRAALRGMLTLLALAALTWGELRISLLTGGSIPIRRLSRIAKAARTPNSSLLIPGPWGPRGRRGRARPTDPAPRAHAIVQAVTHYNDPAVLAEISKGLGDPMSSIAVSSMSEEERLAKRGW